MVGTDVHDNEFARRLFPEGIPWDVEVNGIERCAYCGSINPEIGEGVGVAVSSP